MKCVKYIQYTVEQLIFVEAQSTLLLFLFLQIKIVR